MFLVLGATGGAVGASLITGADIKDGSVTTKDVKDKTLKTGDLSEKTLDALTGPRGAPGAPGAPGQVGYQFIDGPATPVNSAAFATLTVTCPAGTTVLGGSVTSVPAGISLTSGGPTDVDEWSLRVANPSDGQMSVTPHAVCTRP